MVRIGVRPLGDGRARTGLDDRAASAKSAEPDSDRKAGAGARDAAKSGGADTSGPAGARDAAKSGEADTRRRADAGARDEGQARGDEGQARGDPGPSPKLPFEQTTRWLRGRIVARLRDGDPDAWHRLPDELGSHGFERVASAVSALERDGLLERRPDGSVRLPSKAM
jgi:hypothetical protein